MLSGGILRASRSNTLEVTPSTCNSHGREKAHMISRWTVKGQEGEAKALCDKTMCQKSLEMIAGLSLG